jgi:hypothetical protein
MSLPEAHGGGASFDTFDTSAYTGRHYSELDHADADVAEVIISAIVENLGDRFGSFEGAFEIGNAAVLRTSALAEPLLRSDAEVTFSDVGKTQRAAARLAVARVQEGDLGIWEAHQLAMGKVDHRWANAVTNICRRDPIVAHHNILENPVPPAGVRVEGHTLCSHTNRAEVYEQALDNFLVTMEPGDVAIRIFDVGSTGYFVGGRWFEGYPINLNTVRAEAKKRGLTILGIREVPIKVATDEVTRTGSTFSAIGGAVLLKSSTSTVIT